MTELTFGSFSWRRSALLVALVFATSTWLQAQIYVVEYMKVTPGQGENYLKVEKEWAKLHQKRLDMGIINAWSLYQKLMWGANDEYDYATVTQYPNWKSYEGAYPEGLEEGFDEEIMEMTGQTRTLVRSEAYVQRSSASNSKPSPVISIAFMQVAQGMGGDYVEMEDTYFKKFHEGLIEAGARNSWGVYQRISPFGTGNGYNYVAVNGYESLAHMDGEGVAEGTYDAAWEKARGDKTMDEIGEMANTTRDMVSTVMWRRIDLVAPEQ